MRALVIYATCEGQTERIAMRIAEQLSGENIPTDTYNVTQLPADEIAIDAYDAVVLGSSLHYGQHDPRIAWIIATHRELLSDIPSALFSVSLATLGEQAKERSEEDWVAGEFLRELRYDPPLRASFAGALRYSRYGWLKRHMMHRLVAKVGHPTVMDHDYEYTDWPAVDRFARRFARFVRSCEQPKPTQPLLTSASEPFNRYSTRRRDLSERR